MDSLLYFQTAVSNDDIETGVTHILGGSQVPGNSIFHLFNIVINIDFFLDLIINHLFIYLFI